jgi:hypothetical protein
MDLDDFIIRLFKAHLMIYPPNEPPERKQEEEKENNTLSYTWLCIDGKPINHVINFDSIEGKHFLHKIKTFIVDYPQMLYVEERKEKTLLEILVRYGLPSLDVHDLRQTIEAYLAVAQNKETIEDNVILFYENVLSRLHV